MDITKQIDAIENMIKAYVINENVDFYNPITWMQRNPSKQLSTATVVTSFAGAVRKLFKYKNNYSVAMFVDSSIVTPEQFHNIIEKIVDNLKPINLMVSDKLLQDKYVAISFVMEF